MNTQNIKLIVVEGIPDEKHLKALIDVYTAIFNDTDVNFFIDRIHTKEDLVIISVIVNNKVAGFKIGYRYNETTFYSWVGGVLADFRRKGIAQKLANKQEELVRLKGYKRLRTKSMNRFKPMLILNLKNGFDIVQVYTNAGGQQKIVFEKDL